MVAEGAPRRTASRNGNGRRVVTTAIATIGVVADPIESAKSAGLVYETDANRGYSRRGTKTGWVYVAPDGSEVCDERELERIRKLAIPPAWTDVWISRKPRGHLQATGRDARGRKQYRYHPRWREVRDEAKYGHLTAFGQMLPGLRARVEADLGRRGLPREKVLATVVRLLEVTLVRVGNEEYARANRSYGLTTLRDGHVDVNGSQMRFRFRGKSGKEHTLDVKDRRLARIVKRSRDLPGYELFQYVDDDGVQQTIGSSDVNDYLRSITGEETTAKHFRTWAGTLLAATALEAMGPAEKESQAKNNVNTALKLVAERLGNTPTITRKCYVHPAVIDAYMAGETLDLQAHRGESAGDTDLVPEERALLDLLSRRL